MFEFNKKKFNYDMVENQMVNRDMKVMENIPENLYPVRYATKHLKSNKNYNICIFHIYHLHSPLKNG